MEPIDHTRLSLQGKVDAALAEISGRQCRRLVRFLATRDGVLTGTLASATAIGNVSDCAARARPHLRRFGLEIQCERPARPVRNRFGEVSQQQIWRLVEISPRPPKTRARPVQHDLDPAKWSRPIETA